MVAMKHPLNWDQRNSHVSLLSKLDFSLLSSLGHHVLVLNTHNTTAPVSSESFVLVELSTEILSQELEVLEVLLSDLSQSNAGCGLLVDELAEACLTLDEGVGDTLLSAESGKECHDLKRVYVVSDDNELSTALLNEVGNVVKTELEDDGLGTLLGLTTVLFGLSLSVQPSLILLVRLWLVLSEQFKELACYRILIISIVETDKERH